MVIIIRGDYDRLAEISKGFDREAANVKRSIDSLNRTIEVLRGGDWFGEGADAFYREMESQVMPSMQRLLKALQLGSGTTRKVVQQLEETEQNITGLFATLIGSIEVGISVEISGLGGAVGAAVGGGGGGGGGSGGGGGGGGAGGSEPEKPASGGGGGGSGGGAGGGGSGGGGGGSWDGEIGFKPERPAQSGQATGRRRGGG
jgi:WXG100 family type VII secretion target